MGLDMYAYRVSKKNRISEVDFKFDENDAYQFHYWRKHHDLHGWMEKLYYRKGGEKESFNCVPVELTLEDLDNLEEDIKNRKLPHTITKQRYLESEIPLSKLHDWLSVEITAQENREMIFDIPAHIIKRLDMQLNHYKLETITKNSQLVRVAQSLKNCSAGYKHRINEKLQLVMISDDTGKILALLQIIKNSIVQAKLYGNKSVSDRMEINDLVIDFAEKTKLDIRTGNIITNKNNVEFARIA